MLVEIAVQDIEGARISQSEGIRRIELAAALETGGLTPSLGLLAQAVDLGLSVQVLIRPRAGDFVYTPDEVAVATADIEAALRAGADGIVIGALTPGTQPRLDIPTLHAWMSTARTISPTCDVTVHRCVDLLLGSGVSTQDVADQIRALPGITRILSSGGSQRAGDGAATLKELGELLSGEVSVLAGGGVTPESIPALATAGVREFHLSARRDVATGPTGPGGGSATRPTTDPQIVREAIKVAFREVGI